MHLWLDPSNAKAMAAEIAKSLGDADPANKVAYEANLTVIETARAMDARTLDILKK